MKLLGIVTQSDEPSLWVHFLLRTKFLCTKDLIYKYIKYYTYNTMYNCIYVIYYISLFTNVNKVFITEPRENFAFKAFIR